MKSFLDVSELNDAVRPANDFFAYVNGKWVEENPIPPEESRWGSFYVLRVEVEKQIRALLDEIAQKPDASLDPIARKVRDFYASGMDIEKRNSLGEAPLKTELLDAVGGIKDLNDLSAVVGRLHRRGIGGFWAPNAEPDAKKSDTVTLYLYQSGLSLPDRDYYLNEDEKSMTIRAKYETYATGMQQDISFRKIMALETALARASMTRVELRDVEKQYNKKSMAELKELAPHVNWEKYFEATGIKMPEYAIVCQPDFMKAVDRMFAETPIGELKDYLRWHALNEMANYLTEDHETRSFDFYGRTFGGAKEMKARWRRVLGIMNALLDEALGKLYVERHFSEDAKKKVKDLVEHLVVAYRARILKLDWMGEETKKKALVKLAAMTKKLGYPEKWKDFGPLEVTRDSYAENYLRAYIFEFDRHMKKIGGPVDRSEWHSPPQIVNAFYDPLMNEILFPAAILQSPFFDPAADDAVNFGGIGTVIGHELTHGFDDQGALFDPQGNLSNWWTAEDKERFDKKTAHLAAQFDAYEPLPGLHVNGKLTLGENIADLGGMYIAYDGLKLVFAEKGVPEPIDGLTAWQRFFIAYAVTERGAVREEALRLQIQTDPHSPSEYRVNGPLSNMPEFYDAFGAKEGDTLLRDPDDRVAIW